MDAIRIQRKIAVISSLEELFPPRGTEGGKGKNGASDIQKAVKRTEAVV